MSYGRITNGSDSITVDGKFTDATRTYTVSEERGNFLKISDGTTLGWVFRSNVEQVNTIAPEAPKRGSDSRVDPLLGENVFWKYSAVAMVGSEVVDTKYLDHPARVGEVNGEWLWLGRAWVRKSDCMLLKEAFEFYVEEVRKKPQSRAAWGRRADCWKAKGELKYAIQDYSEMIRIDPGYPIAFNNRGVVQYELKDYVGAIKDYEEAIRLDPSFAKAYNNCGIARSNVKQYADAIKDFDVAIRLVPGNGQGYNNRGNSKSKLKDYAGAVDDYNEAIRLSPQDPVPYNGRGWSKHGLKDYAGAIDDYNEAIRLGPKYTVPRLNKSMLLATAEDETVRNPQEAKRLADSALADEPDSGYGMNAVACALAAQGDFDGAVAWQRKASANPDWQLDEDIDGGSHSTARITAWSAKQLWHP